MKKKKLLTTFLSLGLSVSAAWAQTNFTLTTPLEDRWLGEVITPDMDGDGRSDIVEVTDEAILISLSTGQGSFYQPIVHPIKPGKSLPVMTANDFNRDGKMDIAVATFEQYPTSDNAGFTSNVFVTILHGDKKGGVTERKEYTFPSERTTLLQKLISADVNADQIPDLLLIERQDQVVTPSILIIESDATQGYVQEHKSGIMDRAFGDLIADDLDKDGYIDLLISGADALMGQYGSGTGNFFNSWQSYIGPMLMLSADFNRDGNLDVLIANSGGEKQIRLLPGNSRGTFNPSIEIPVGFVPEAATLGDYNVDGYTDVAYASGSRVYVLLSQESKLFASEISFEVGTPISPNTREVNGNLQTGDFNGDQKPDLLAANRLLLNSTLTADQAVFYRAINLNGPSLVIDGKKWDGKDSPNYTYSGTPWSSPNVTLNPATDANRASMIRNFIGGSSANITLKNIASGTYYVYVYLWEDNAPQPHDLYVQGVKVLDNVVVGGAGAWKKYGPYRADVSNGTINVLGNDGAPNIAGIEVHKVNPAPTTLYRAININGPAMVIDNKAWEGKDAPNVSYSGTPWYSPNVQLTPRTDFTRAAMIRTFIGGSSTKITLKNINNGPYQVYVHLWEDNAPQSHDLYVQGVRVLENIVVGNAGAWKRFGPYDARVTDGTIQVLGNDGAPNIAAIEVYSVTTPVARESAEVRFETSEQPSVGLRAFPNPVLNGQFRLQATGLAPAVEAEVLIKDLTGKVLWANSYQTSEDGKLQQEVKSANLKPGMYLLTVKSAQKSQSIKIIVQ